MNITKAIEIAKPFVGSLRKKTDSRPILKTALVTKEHVVATDSHILVRVKHSDSIESSYLHHYKSSTNGYGPEQYPQTDKLFPDPDNATTTLSLDTKEWIGAPELALTPAKELKNKATTLKGDKITVDYSGETPNFNGTAFTYTLDQSTNIEKVSYSCEYMLTALKAFKKAKQSKVTCYFYGPFRPMLFKADNIEVILMPIRTY